MFLMPKCRGDWDLGLCTFWGTCDKRSAAQCPIFFGSRHEPLRNGDFREKTCFARRKNWNLALRSGSFLASTQKVTLVPKSAQTFSSLMGPYETIGEWFFFSWLLGRSRSFSHFLFSMHRITCRPIYFGMNPHRRLISTDFWLKSTVDATSTVFSSMWILIDRRYRQYSQVVKSLLTIAIDRILK